MREDYDTQLKVCRCMLGIYLAFDHQKVAAAFFLSDVVHTAPKASGQVVCEGREAQGDQSGSGCLGFRV